jgi:hypothetical protein
MRVLMKIDMPGKEECPLRQDSGFETKWKDLLASLGAQSVISNDPGGDRVDYAVFDIKDLAVMFDLAQAVHEWLGVKPEFLPEVTPKSYFGRK